MNTNLKLLAAVIIGSSLAACGGGGGGGNDSSSSSSSSVSSSAGNGSSSSVSDEYCEENPLDPACDPEIPESEIDVTNQELPFTETFVVDAGAEGNQVEAFFSPDYKRLATEMPQTLPNGEEYEDPNPSLWYATCCFIASEDNEDTGEVAGEVIPDIDERQYVGIDGEGNGYMAISNARFTLGQLQPDIIDNDEVSSGDAKTGSTDAPVGNSWGEFDLSEPYRVSFCLKDTGNAGAGTGGNLEVYVDNNSGGNQGHSIHGNQSLLLRTTAAGLEAGNRVVIDVPGDVRLQDNNGDQLEDGLLGTTADIFGTEHSFLQFRVSSGGYAVISDLKVEHQADVEAYTPCEVDEELFQPALPEGIAFGGLPFVEDFADITTDQFLGSGDDAAGNFLAMSDDLTVPFYGFNSSGRIHVEDGMMSMTNNRFTMGFKGLDDTEENQEVVEGDMDLSVPYTITFEIEERPASDEARLQVLLDNSTTTAADSKHGEASALLATTWDNLGTGTLEIRVPGGVFLNDVAVTDSEGDQINIDSHIGTETSFIQVWCPSDCGDAATYDEDQGGFVDDEDVVIEGAGVTFSEISIDYQGDAPGTDPDAIWTADNLQILGEDSVEGSVLAEDETSMQIEATGGNVDSSNHSIFFAHQQTDMSDFSFTARIASVEGADASAGNGKRFGLMVMNDISNKGSYPNVGGWADIGFYANGDPVELIGSRGNKKPDGSRTRSDIEDAEDGIPSIAPGDYVRIEVFDDGENKRVRRCVSTDDGVTWIQANSTTDFDATAEDDSWYYGVYAAPGANEITMDVDNISIEEYTDTECE